MDIVLRIIAVALGVVGLFVYFRSVVRVVLLNWRERDALSRCVCQFSIAIVQRLNAAKTDYADIQRSQAWILPIFVLLSVVSWFLLVQISFALILWGLKTEATFALALSASGSALSTLGFKTPPTLLGEFLAVFEGAIGLVVVVLLFSFVPGYLTAIQARERGVGWLYARTGHNPTCTTVLGALENSGKTNDPAVWETWESWFRGIYETHAVAPILSYAPSIYRNTNWVGGAAAILDSASLLIATLDPKQVNAAHICRHAGVATVKLLANELRINVPAKSQSEVPGLFDQLYDKLASGGLPVSPDREKCRQAFAALKAEYEPSLLHISAATRMPIHH